MPSYLTARPPYRGADDIPSDAPEPMIGYEAALPYLLSGHDGARCGSDGPHHEAPLSCGDARAPD